MFLDAASWPLWSTHRKPFFKLFFYVLGCVGCGCLAFIPLLFSFAHLGYNSLVRDVFLNSHLRHVTGTFIPVICLSLSQTLYSSISSNLRKCLFRAVPLNATYRRPLLILQGLLLSKAPQKKIKKSSAGRCVLNVLHLHKHSQPKRAARRPCQAH